MKDTIEFYDSIRGVGEDNLKRLTDSQGWSKSEFEKRGIVFDDPNRDIALTEDEIYGIMNSFPESFRNRISVGYILGNGPLWFKSEKLEVTGDVNEALSQTSIIPSHISHANQDKKQNISLFKLENVDPKVARIIHGEGFIHELAHTANFPGHTGNYEDLMNRGIVVRYDNGREVPFKKMVSEFEELMKDSSPITNYSSFYWSNNDGKVQTDKLELAVNEELAESIAAYQLGFAMTPNPENRLNPFEDRPKIKEFVEDLINSEFGK